MTVFDAIAEDKQEVTVAILSQKSTIAVDESPWKLTIDRLNQHPDYHFTPLFLNAHEIEKHLDNDELDFVVTDAINYLRYEKKYGILHLLTRSEEYSGNYVSSEALSVYTLNSNSDIIRLNDLQGKQVAILEDNITLSQLFLEKFLLNHQLVIDDNLHTIPMDSVNRILPWLQKAQIDAVITRAGLIEKHLEPAILEKLRLINPRRGWQAPFLHSSVLIPEWAFSKAWFIDDRLANQIIALLINAHYGPTASSKDDYYLPQHHWGIAQNYNKLTDLLSLTETMDASELSEQQSFSPKIQYWISFIIICFLLIILFMYLRSSRDLNSRLKASKESLEQEIRERQHAQEQALNHQAELAHVARLSTMGEMASGLAHELNQPLSAIHTYVQGCIRRINMGNNEPEAIINALQLTAQQADRAGGIIRRLRSFVRKGESHKTYTEINHIVNEVTSFLDTQLKNKKVSLSLDLEDNLPPVLADIIQIEQVLINLLKNGIEAMADIDEPTIKVSTRRFNNNYVELCVIDSGHGISEDKLKRIFNPFFTTKTSGMGMGLSISSSIIEAHDGKLYAENNTDRGARFCFTLPITEEQLGNNNNE